MIRDANGEELTYWPISGLEEGQDSAHLTVYVDTPQTGALRARSSSARAQVWARIGDSGGFTNITTGEIALAGLAYPETAFEIFVRATGPIPNGFERVSLTVGPAAGQPAAWMA